MHIPYSGIVWQGESLVNRLVLNIWRKKVWQIHNRLLIVSTNLDGLVWQIVDNLPNLPNFPAIRYCFKLKKGYSLVV